MKKTLIALFAMMIAGGAALPAQAAEALTIHRFGLEASLGTNVIFPFAQGKVSYRLPVFDDRVDLVGAYSLNAGFGVLHVLALGVRYYFNPSGWFQPYAGVGGFAAFHRGHSHAVVPNRTPEMSSCYPGHDERSSNGYQEPFWPTPVFGGGYLGIGSDFMFFEHLGLSASIQVSYPLNVRPEVGLKVAF